MTKISMTTAVLGLALILAPACGQSAELKVLAGGAMTASLKDLGPKFEAATGHKLSVQSAGTPELIKLATSEPFDLGVVPVDVFKNADAKAKFAAGPTVDIARVGYGIAIKAGAAKPDMSTPEAMKQALLKAQSVTLFPESAAGAFVLKTFERLGIAEEMKAKTKPLPIGKLAEAVAKGDAEFAVFLTNVLIAPGVELAGQFPGDLQNDLVFTSAVAADSKQAAAAKAFIDYLKTPEAMAVIKAKGMKAG